jgi:hypothetical protein
VENRQNASSVSSPAAIGNSRCFLKTRRLDLEIEHDVRELFQNNRNFAIPRGAQRREADRTIADASQLVDSLLTPVLPELDIVDARSAAFAFGAGRNLHALASPKPFVDRLAPIVGAGAPRLWAIVTALAEQTRSARVRFTDAISGLALVGAS